jgi:phage major head subunit gpT-like protein
MLQQGQYGRLLEPGLRKIFFETYKEVPEQYSRVFNVEKSTKAIETDFRMGGFGLWEKKESGGMTKFQDTPTPQALQYIHEEFGAGFTVERKMMDDDQYSQIKKMPQALGRAARATIETKSADILNGAFSNNGFDGVPLISTTHKRLDGGTLSNQLQASVAGSGVDNGFLSDRNLKAAMVQMRKQVDDKGILIQAIPNILVVPPQLEYIAKTIVGSQTISLTGNGMYGVGQAGGVSTSTADSAVGMNAIQNKLEVVVMDYLSDSKTWFLMDTRTAQLNFFWRVKPEFKSETDFETDQYAYKGYMRFSVGYSDYRGIVGSNGTGLA